MFFFFSRFLPIAPGDIELIKWNGNQQYADLSNHELSILIDSIQISEFCPLLFTWQQVIFGLDGGVAPNRWQVVVRANDDLADWRIYVPHSTSMSQWIAAVWTMVLSHQLNLW